MQTCEQLKISLETMLDLSPFVVGDMRRFNGDLRQLYELGISAGYIAGVEVEFLQINDEESPPGNWSVIGLRGAVDTSDRIATRSEVRRLDNPAFGEPIELCDAPIIAPGRLVLPIHEVSTACLAWEMPNPNIPDSSLYRNVHLRVFDA